jgi:hypothetical protein
MLILFYEFSSKLEQMIAIIMPYALLDFGTWNLEILEIQGSIN